MRDTDVDTLLDLNGSILVQENGHWMKIEARRVSACPAIPHGIAYCLTLHDRNGKRVLGFDNAHAVRPPKKFKYAGRITHDHRHRRPRDKGYPYEFRSAHQLLSDFFDAVDAYLAREDK